ncbi:hypothetical protein [Nostoc sp. TCL26-01]|uniref:hypothetical protein n=1 Tax=Nostoc sp. TCL26-01 TaxID=2576904 RepID=UPI0015B9A4D6|nr:hypothetical protein [Nostoc sp. TCL26-01]QLE59988.1 hypothetical protein FD725_31760 [Nostoc sp. TCL26-01]
MCTLNLISGIKIFDGHTSLDSPDSRIHLNTGIINASNLLIPTQRYSPIAYIPKSDWRVPNTEESKLLRVTKAPFESGNWVSIIRIPDDVLAPFKQLRDSTKIEKEQTLFNLKKTSDCQKGISQVIEYIAPLSETASQYFEGIGISLNLPGLITSTVDYERNCYIGLHLDSWYGASLKERHLSRNRICINLGHEDRFLLLVNLSLQTMFDILETDKSNDPKTLIFNFMQYFSNYPVIRLKIAPNEAYIAPTENIIHDGSTLGQMYFDTCLTIRGKFKSSFLSP